MKLSKFDSRAGLALLFQHLAVAVSDHRLAATGGNSSPLNKYLTEKNYEWQEAGVFKLLDEHEIGSK